MRVARALVLLTWLLVGALAVRTGAGLWALASSWDGLPKWDMAKYGAAGAHLAHAVKDLDPLDFARAVGELDLWGPVFPLIEATAFVPFGPTYRTASGGMVVLFVLTIMAGFWAGRQVGGDGRDLAGALVAASVAVSPAFQLFGTLVMLEIPGALLLFLAVGNYARSLRSSAPRDFTLACLAAVLLFFLKFNYGLAWLVPFVLAEIWLAAGSLAALRAQAVTRLRLVAWRRPWRIFLLAYAAGILALAIFGGRVNDPSGQASRSISLGTPLYILYILVLAHALIRPRRSWARLKAWYATAGPRPRAIALVILLPIAIWMLPPSHARGFVRVLENRDAGPSLWTPSGALFYPRAFLQEFSPSVAVGGACLVLVVLAVVLWPRLSPPNGVIVLALVLGLIGTLVHPYKLTRFLFPLVPLLWLAAATALVWVIRRPITPRLRTLVASSTAALVLILAIFVPIDRGRLTAGLVENSVPATLRPVATAVAQAAATARGSVLAGYWNDFSPGLVEWDAWQSVRAFEASDVPRSADQVLRDAGPQRLPEIAAQRSNVSAVLILDLQRDDSAWREGWTQETGWLDPARRAMETDPRWRLRSQQVFPASGYRLRVYERRPGPRS
jgi:phosphate starvation-inducible membrane PsiE